MSELIEEDEVSAVVETVGGDADEGVADDEDAGDPIVEDAAAEAEETVVLEVVTLVSEDDGVAPGVSVEAELSLRDVNVPDVNVAAPGVGIVSSLDSRLF